MKWYLDVLKKYAVFTGRARRKEYWMFTLFQIIFLVIAMGIDAITGLSAQGSPVGVFYMLYVLGTIIPSLAVVVRRLHDINKSGWMYFVILIPFIGSIWLLILMLTEGTQGDNNYGPDPKLAEAVGSDGTLDGHLTN